MSAFPHSHSPSKRSDGLGAARVIQRHGDTQPARPVAERVILPRLHVKLPVVRHLEPPYIGNADNPEYTPITAGRKTSRAADRQHGFRTTRYPASEVWRDPLNCAQQIRRELERLRRIAARKAA